MTTLTALPEISRYAHILRNQAEVDYVNRTWFQAAPREMGSGVRFISIEDIRQFNQAMGYAGKPRTFFEEFYICEPLPLPG